MGLFRRGKAADKNKEDRALISSNERAIDALIILSEQNEEMKEDLKAVKEKIKYLVPSAEGKILDFDKKIKNLIEDMRIALVKADGETNKKVESILKDIKLAIADRNAKV